MLRDLRLPRLFLLMLQSRPELFCRMSALRAARRGRLGELAVARAASADSRLPRSFVVRNASRAGRFTPLHPRIAAARVRAAPPLEEQFFRHKDIHRPNSQFAAERSRDLVARLARGE